jgi:RNA polymerase sigma factor (sigma-70 family)
MDLQGHPDRIEAFRRGDRETLAALYRAHVGEVEQLLRRGFTFQSRGQSVRFRGYDEPFRLQEAIQDGFMHAFRQQAREAYDGEQPYLPFLLTIVRNNTLDRVRREQTEARYIVHAESLRVREGEGQAVEQLGASGAHESPEIGALQAELRGLLGRFVEELDALDGALVRGHLLGELSQQQIADELGESRNDVRKRLKLLRERLLRFLKAEGFIETLDAGEVLRQLSVMSWVLL